MVAFGNTVSGHGGDGLGWTWRSWRSFTALMILWNCDSMQSELALVFPRYRFALLRSGRRMLSRVQDNSCS